MQFGIIDQLPDAVQLIAFSAEKSLKIYPGEQNKETELKYKVDPGGDPNRYCRFNFVELEDGSPQLITID